MLRLTFRSLWSHKRRLLSTVVAIVLGVAFMCGTFVLSDTLDKVFDDLFASTNAKVDAQVQGEVLFSDPFGDGDQRADLPETLVDDVRGLDGVAGAEGSITVVGFGSVNRVLDDDGEPIGSDQGPPTLLESWGSDADLSPYVLQDGRGPEADGEIAMNIGATEDAGFEVGDEVTVLSQFGPEQYQLVGTFTFGTAKSAAGAVSVDFTLAEAQRLAGIEGKVQTVVARAENGVSQEQLAERLAAMLPDDAEVITGAEAAAQLSSDVQSGFSFFKQALTIFAGIALLVGVFVISNTFAILVAQRTRELALLRAVGASRWQVLSSVLLEAIVVGLVAAALGLGAGILLANGVIAALAGGGADLPTTTVIVRSTTVVIAFAIGLLVTLVAALFPAIRATRVPPLAALRDVAVDRAGASKIRLAVGLVMLALAALCLSAAWRSGGNTDALQTVGLGAVLAIVAAIVIGPVVAGPSVKAIGVLLPRLKGITGRVAVENAARSPKRTSATASAIIIGVALVGFITVFAASAKASIVSSIQEGFSGDFVIQSSAGGGIGFPSGFPTTVAEEAVAADGVASVSPLGFGVADITYPNGDSITFPLTAVDPVSLLETLDPVMSKGRLTDLTDDGIIVDRQLAKDNDVSVGDVIDVTLAGGTALELRVQAISNEPNLLGNFVITRDLYKTSVPQLLDNFVYGKVESGADLDAVVEAVGEAVSGTPSLKVLDRDGFAADLTAQITSFVNIIYGLLGLSIIVALIGIANTLSLSINERTRELGLLRSVGMNRSQLRSTIRWEAVLISVLGTLVGLGLGLALSRAVLKGLEGQGLTEYTVPVMSLVIITVLAALLGVAASILPARRAARLAILDAIATD